MLADCAFLSPALFTSAVRAPADVTPHWPAFRTGGPHPPAPHLTLLNDWLVQFHPWQHMVRDSWRAGRPPLWNDRSACGEPLLGNSQSEALSPYLPLNLLADDQYVDWRQLAQLAVAQAFVLLLAARLGMSPAAGTVAAIAYSFSSYMQVWAIHPHAASASFAPAIAWGLLLVVEKPRATTMLCAAGAVACSILAGHLETAAKAAATASALVLLWSLTGAARRGPVRAAALIAAAVVAGLLLAACGVLPFLDYLGESDVREIRAGAELARGVPPEHLLTLLDPDWFGSPLEPPTYRGAVNYPDGVLHVGWVAAALAVAGLLLGAVRQPRTVIPPAIVLAIAIAIACAPPAIGRLWTSVPVLGGVWRFRMLFAATLPIAMLAGAGWDACKSLATRWPPAARSLAAAAVVAAALATAALPWRNLLPHAGVADLHPGSRPLEKLRERSLSGRAAELGGTLPAGLGQLYGYPSIKRYDAVGLRRFSEAFQMPEGRYRVFNGFDLTFAPPAILDALSVKWILAPHAASETRAPAGTWRVETGREASLDLRRIAEGLASVDLVVFRYGQPVRDGTIEIVARLGDEEARWSLTATGWAARAGPRAEIPRSPAVSEFVSTHLRGIASEAILIPSRAAAGAPGAVSLAVAPGGAPFFATALVPGGVGRAVAVAGDFGALALSDRFTAMPYVYLSPGISRVADRAAAARAVRSEGFDPHVGTVVEAPPDANLPDPGVPLSEDRIVSVRRRPGKTEVVVTTGAGRVLVSTDAFARGWRASVDGKATPVRPANLVGMSCSVPQGRHTVVFQYAPVSFTAGCAVSGATLLALVLGAVARRRPRSPA